MSAFYYSIAIVIASQIVYQLTVKAVPAKESPFGFLAIVYGLSMLVCLVLSRFVGQPLVLLDFKRLSLSWQIWLLAIAVVGIEFGYLLAYRSGWKVGVTYAVASTTTVSVLALLGLFWFSEPLGVRGVLGVGCVLAGGLLVMFR